MGTSPDQIRADIEATRTDLAKDVSRLTDQTSPRRMARRRAHRAHDAATSIRERIMGTASESVAQTKSRVQETTRSAREGNGPSVQRHAGQAAQEVKESTEQAMGTARETAEQATEAARQAPDQAARQVQGNPLAAGLISFGAGLLTASLLPRTAAERQAKAQLSDRAADIVEPVKHAAEESAQRLKSDAAASAKEAAQEVKETATEAGRATGQQVGEQAGQVKDQARAAGRQVADEAGERSRGQS